MSESYRDLRISVLLQNLPFELRLANPPDEDKVLRLKRNIVEDRFAFDLYDIVASTLQCQPTKRNVISVASRMYDFLGFLSFIAVQQFVPTASRR